MYYLVVMYSYALLIISLYHMPQASNIRYLPEVSYLIITREHAVRLGTFEHSIGISDSLIINNKNNNKNKVLIRLE